MKYISAATLSHQKLQEIASLWLEALDDLQEPHHD
jgi:hypothetical protein